MYVNFHSQTEGENHIPFTVKKKKIIFQYERQLLIDKYIRLLNFNMKICVCKVDPCSNPL